MNREPVKLGSAFAQTVLPVLKPSCAKEQVESYVAIDSAARLTVKTAGVCEGSPVSAIVTFQVPVWSGVNANVCGF
jgi:hypothetical protein